MTSNYERRTDTKVTFKTGAVKGNKRLEMPIFILTSNDTFSAAEAFAYDLQSIKRATVIGETTGGGAHPVDFIRFTKEYALIVSYAESVNPVTKTNWEGVGVIPNVKIAKEKALNKGKRLAIMAAAKYREKPFYQKKKSLKKKKKSSAICLRYY